MSNLTAALEYAARGYEVLPVRESKAPYTTHGVKDATLNPEAITKWWNIWPHALIGIRCSKSFGYVLDVDVSGSKVGDETLKELEKTHIDLSKFSLHLHNQNEKQNVKDIITYSIKKGIYRFDVSHMPELGGCSVTMKNMSGNLSYDQIYECYNKIK